MKGTISLRGKVALAYLCIFYVLACWKWLDGGWLYQYEPFVFQTRTDGVTWVFMRTGMHQWLINHPGMYVWADVLFYVMPGLWYLIDRKWPAQSWIVGWVMLLINWIYVQLFTLYPTNSIEGHFAWLVMPALFVMRDMVGFSLTLSGLRYIFLFFFFSSGFWKIFLGGVFNPMQLKDIITFQHGHLLAVSPDSAFTAWIEWLIAHPMVCWVLYILATLIELVFFAGFFTTKWDRVLIVLFLLFLVFDKLVMQIDYYEMIPMLIPLYFASEGRRRVV